MFDFIRRVLDSDARGLQRLLLVELADLANEAGQAWPSVTTLAQRSGLSRRTVYRVINELEELGWLSRDQNGRRSNLYCLQLSTASARVAHKRVSVSESPKVVTESHTNALEGQTVTKVCHSDTPMVTERHTNKSINKLFNKYISPKKIEKKKTPEPPPQPQPSRRWGGNGKHVDFPAEQEPLRIWEQFAEQYGVKIRPEMTYTDIRNAVLRAVHNRGDR